MEKEKIVIDILFKSGNTTRFITKGTENELGNIANVIDQSFKGNFDDASLKIPAVETGVAFIRLKDVSGIEISKWEDKYHA